MNETAFWCAFWALGNAFMVWVLDCWITDAIHGPLAFALCWAFNDELKRS